MCISPNKILNPYRGFKGRLAFMHDCESQYIYIPCGVCKECIALKQMYLVQRVQMEARNSFLFFSTLTYNNEFLPHYVTPTGYSIPFADPWHLQCLFKRIRNYNLFGRDFRYLACSERGGEKGRPHFHILWFLPRYSCEDYVDGLSLQNRLYEQILKNWVVNLGSKRKPDYQPLCTFKQRFVAGHLKTNYDTHFVTPSLTSDGVSSVAFYVCKYMMKQNDRERRLQQALRLNLDPVDYDEAFSVVKSRSLRSSHFGYGFTQKDYYDIIDYLRKGVDLSKSVSPYPCYYASDSHSTFPLCTYYKSNPYIFSVEDWMDFHMNDDSVILDYNKTLTQCDNAIKSFQRVSQMVNEKDFSLDLNLFYEE